MTHRTGPAVLTSAIAVFVVGIVTAQQPTPPAPQQPSEIVTTITGNQGAVPHYAVPEFIAVTPNAASIAQMLSQVLWDDLNFERAFDMIPRDVYKSVPVARSPEQVPFASWREVGADAVFFGTVTQKGNDVIVQVRLFNVRTRESVFGQEYTTTARNARRIVHEVADAVHKQQAGVRGVARTRLTYVSDRTRQSLLGTVEKRNAKEVWISDYDGANEIRITNSRDLNLNPTWAPDGSAIAYAALRGGSAYDILLSYITTGVLQNVTKGWNAQNGGVSLPSISPDGKRIVFHATPEKANAPDLFVANIDGSNRTRITTHPDSDTTPTWSPDGKEIAFTSDRTGRPQIYIMNADGTGTRRLPITDGEADRATWSPAPYNEIAYTARNGPGYDIKIHNLKTGQTRQLTFSEGTNESPSYSPSGRHLAFSSTRAGLVQIFTIGSDGNGLRQITRSGNNQTPDWSN